MAVQTEFEKPIYKRTSVYREDRSKEPKHMFKVIGNEFERRLSPDARLLDVGAASGDLAAYLAGRFRSLDITCLEYDAELVALGASRHPDIHFVEGDAENMAGIPDSEFDAVTMVGVLSIFDRFEPTLQETLRVVKPGGRIIIISPFNDYPVDFLTRWRYSGDDGAFHRGYNIFSKKTLGAFLDAEPNVAAWSFEKFVLPFDLAPNESDPIRSWTEFDGGGNRIFKNGLQMEINLQLLRIERNA